MIGSLPISKEKILKHVSEYSLFKHYISAFERVGKLFKSELRADKNTSAIINEYKGHLRYSDFGNGDNLDVFSYIMKKYNISYWDCLLLINSDFSLGYAGVNKQPLQTFKEDYNFKKEGTSSIMSIKSRLWCKKDGDFWLRKYGITLDTLNKYRVYPLECYYINNNRYKADDLAYGYYYGNVDNVDRWKIYQPYNENYKWCSNTNSSIIQGFDQLYTNDLLILTKSLKDIMVFSLAGYNACSLQAESTKLTRDHLDKLKVKTNYSELVVIYDNDDAGKMYADRITTEYGIQSIYFPEGTKDASEFVESYSYEGLIEYVESNLSK